MRHAITGLLLAATASPAVAQSTFVMPEVPRYFYLQGDYVEDAELEGNVGSTDGDGYGASLWVPTSQMSFVTVDYRTVDNDQGDLDELTFGIGLHGALTPALDLYGTINYDRLELDLGSQDFDANGFGARAGLRAFLMDDRVELFGEGQYSDYGDADVGGGAKVDVQGQFLTGGIVVNITPAVGLHAEYRTGTYELDFQGTTDVDRDDVTLGVRVYLD